METEALKPAQQMGKLSVATVQGARLARSWGQELSLPWLQGGRLERLPSRDFGGCVPGTSDAGRFRDAGGRAGCWGEREWGAALLPRARPSRWPAAGTFLSATGSVLSERAGVLWGAGKAGGRKQPLSSPKLLAGVAGEEAESRHCLLN